jgi:hypothetical protein
MTVACVFVKGPYPYTPDYVVKLERMVRRFLTRPFRFVCLTDHPQQFKGVIDTIRIPHVLPGCPEAIGYWNKLQLFNPANGLTGRIAFFDLDVLIVRALDALVDVAAPFALAGDELALTRPAVDRNAAGLTIRRKFNASAMVWDAGVNACLWQDWTPDVTHRLQSDQDWYAERMPHAHALPVSWFPRISRARPPWPSEATVVLVKTPKNHLAAQQWPWFADAWG